MKTRHVDWPRSATFVLRFGSRNWRFHFKRHTLLRTFRRWHTLCARRLSVALRSQGRSPKDTTLLPSSLLLLTSYFLLLPFPRVDRRPAHNQAVCQRADSAVSRRTAAYYIIIPRGCALHATDVVISHTFPIARNQARRSLRRRDRSRLSPRAHTSSPRLLPRRRHGQEQVRQPARRRASNRFRASKPDSPPTEG